MAKSLPKQPATVTLSRRLQTFFGHSLVATFWLGGASAEISFHDDIQPIFNTHCTDCHGPDKQKSGLRLDAPVHILKGGESGEPVFVAGDSKNSHLIKLVTGADPDEVMPPKGDRLTEEEIAKLRLWIDEGARLPGVEALVPTIETDHWSFQPVKKPTPSFEGNAIDAFVQAKLEEHGLTQSSSADKRTLIRPALSHRARLATYSESGRCLCERYW